MIVEVTRRGGIAGLTRRGVADTAALPPSSRPIVEEALRSLPFGRPAPAVSHPDSFQYEIRVGNFPSTVLDEAEVSSGLRPIVDEALAHANLT
jgi:hypothetical protein